MSRPPFVVIPGRARQQPVYYQAPPAQPQPQPRPVIPGWIDASQATPTDLCAAAAATGLRAITAAAVPASDLRAATTATPGPLAKSPQKERVCNAQGCKSKIDKRGLCFRHGSRGKCSIEDCTKHGAKEIPKICTFEGCKTKSDRRGVCRKHGSRGLCILPGCTTNGYAGGLCKKHGAAGICSRADCMTAQHGKEGHLVTLASSSSLTSPPSSARGPKLPLTNSPPAADDPATTGTLVITPDGTVSAVST
eukprot:gene6254-17721_t